MLDPDASRVVTATIQARDALLQEVYYPEAAMTVTIHPDDVPGADQIAGCRVVRDAAMPRGEALVGCERTARESA